MMDRVREALRLIWNTIERFFNDSCSSMAASLSFYTFFSLPALLSILLLIVGSIADPVQVEQAITQQVGGLIGRAGSDQVRTIIAHSRDTPDRTAAAIASVAALIFGATTAFGQLQDALNRVWSVKPDPTRNQIMGFLMKRIFSFGVVLAVAFLLLASLALSAALVAFGDIATARLGVPEVVLEVTNAIISFAVVTVLFAVMFRYLPDARVAWRDVWTGAVGTSILFVAGKSLIGYYLGRSDPGNAYGAAGSLAVVLIWVYYLSIILLFGAEFTRSWAERYGKGSKPQRGAVKVVEEEHAVQRG